MDLSYENDTSRSARFRRELRNPSMITISLIVTVVVLAFSAPFIPTWVNTTRDSLEAIREAKELDDAGRSSLDVLVASQIAPWMGLQAETMLNATGPLDWKVVSFRNGPCHQDNLSQLPVSEYSLAIVSACNSMDDIQQRYSGTCFLASRCNVPDEAKQEITAVMGEVWEEFSDAGFVLPYTDVEEQVLP